MPAVTGTAVMCSYLTQTASIRTITYTTDRHADKNPVFILCSRMCCSGITEPERLDIHKTQAVYCPHGGEGRIYIIMWICSLDFTSHTELFNNTNMSDKIDFVANLIWDKKIYKKKKKKKKKREREKREKKREEKYARKSRRASTMFTQSELRKCYSARKAQRVSAVSSQSEYHKQ